MVGKEEITNWMVNEFPLTVKQQFMGLCKMQDKNWKIVLANLMKKYIHENKDHE